MLNKQELYIIRSALDDVVQEGWHYGVKKHFNKHLHNAIAKVDSMIVTLSNLEESKDKNEKAS